MTLLPLTVAIGRTLEERGAPMVTGQMLAQGGTVFDHHSSSERLRNVMLLVLVLAIVFATVGGTAQLVLDTVDRAGAAMGS